MPDGQRPAAPRRRLGALRPTCRAEAALRAARRPTSSRPTNRRWGRAPGRSPPTRRRRASSSAIRTDRQPRCARRWPTTTGSMRERIVCGAGSDELLSLLAQAYLASRRRSDLLRARIPGLSDRHQGQRRNRRWRSRKGTIVADVDAILGSVSAATRMVFLANPNNPTGTYLPFNEVKRLHAGLPRHCLLVVDAAYAEYVRRNDYESGIELVSAFDNVVMLRTFSKVYGLAALRIGWAYCPAHVADVLNRVRGAFNVSAPAIAAAMAALADGEHVERAVEHNAHWLAWLSGEIGKLGFEVTDSVGNFLLVHFSADKRRGAAAGRRLPVIARARSQAHGGLRASRRPAPHRRQRGGEPRLHRRAHGLRRTRARPRHDETDVPARGAHRARTDRLVAGPRHAARKAGRPHRRPLRGAPRPAPRRSALGLVDSMHESAAGAVRGADLVVLCVPVGACARGGSRDRGRRSSPAPS